MTTPSPNSEIKEDLSRRMLICVPKMCLQMNSTNEFSAKTNFQNFFCYLSNFVNRIVYLPYFDFVLCIRPVYFLNAQKPKSFVSAFTLPKELFNTMPHGS